jgi:energy-coupling factor transporter ATP-binding protein EcfA2
MLIFDALLDALGAILPLLVAVILLAMAVSFGPRAITAWRQRAYDAAVADETVRLELTPIGGGVDDPERPLALIRALHAGERRGTSRWALGWPTVELRTAWRNGRLVWQIDCPKQLIPGLQTTMRPLYPGLDLRVVDRDDPPAAATAIGSFTAPAHWPLGEADLPENRSLHRLAGALESLPTGLEATLCLTARPISATAWRQIVTPSTEAGGRSMGSFLGAALMEGLQIWRSSDQPVAHQPVTLSRDEREAYAGKAKGSLGFEVRMRLELAGARPDVAQAELWKLVEFTQPLTNGSQRIHWEPRPGFVSKAPSVKLADFELAQLWYLPDASFDRLDLPRERPLVAPPPASVVRAEGASVRIGQTQHGDLSLSLDQLSRHTAVFGATGAGKSTLLLHLALGLLETPMGATILDPHGDLAADLLSRVPARHAQRVHVLRLADKAHPRGFNFLERREVDEAQLVTSEFVELFEDLWPKFCGPKMQHYLRQALLTLLSHPEPQTVIELVRVLTDDSLRDEYLDHVDDPMLSAFWRTEWPGPRERDRDTSIKAVLNKLGAFVSYGSIRQVVGQGVSTLRPRQVMDDGDLLVVDLSRVGGDNAQLFGAMLISRYYVDAVGRQGTSLATRRPHLLIIDEAQRFSTRAVEKISVEGRKFGLLLCLATQSLTALPQRLRSTILTNVATIALLSPGAEDVRDLARLFDQIPAEELYRLRRFELVLRALDADGRPTVYGGRVSPLPAGDPRAAEAIIAASDTRDARPLHVVRDEVHRRAGGEVNAPTESDAQPSGNGRHRRKRRHARGPLQA